MKQRWGGTAPGGSTVAHSRATPAKEQVIVRSVSLQSRHSNLIAIGFPIIHRGYWNKAENVLRPTVPRQHTRDFHLISSIYSTWQR